MAYGYLVWDMVLALFWIFFYYAEKNLRKKIIWGSFLALPFGIGQLYFYGNYWTPQTLFNLGAKYGADIESFVLMFLLGGLAAAAYEFVIKKYEFHHYECCKKVCVCYLSLTAALTAFIVLTRAFPSWNIIYPSILGCLAGGIFAFLVYPELRLHIFLGGVIFMILYWATLVISELFLPGWIAATWKLSAISGITTLKVPLEEVLFGFAFGTLWAPLYEETCSNFNIKRSNI